MKTDYFRCPSENNPLHKVIVEFFWSIPGGREKMYICTNSPVEICCVGNISRVKKVKLLNILFSECYLGRLSMGGSSENTPVDENAILARLVE